MGDVLATFPFAVCPLLVIYTNSSIDSALLQYCPAANAKCFKYYKTAKNLPSVHSAQEKKNYQICSIPSELHVPDMSATPIPPRSLPLRKSSNIYIFNPIKNVKQQKKRVHCATQLNISKAHPFCAAVTCIVPKSSSSSRLRLRLPGTEMTTRTKKYVLSYKKTQAMFLTV